MIKHQQASYSPAEISDYENHPLINALPAIMSPEDTARALNRMPKVGDAEKKLPGHIRRHAMMRILDQFLYPTKAHLQLEQMLSGMIRRGYLSRNIADVSHQNNLNSTSDTDFKDLPRRNAGNESLVSSVIGSSGTGKSTAIEAILDTYPQAIYHPEYQHTQLVWLKVECPHDGSVRHLCFNFFRAVDRALGTDYYQLYVKSGVTPETMLGDIAQVSALHSIGVLVIDEIQHLDLFKSIGSEKIMNFFVTLTNVVKVPVLFIGTPKALGLFSETMRAARRSVQFGSLNWNRFERSMQPNKDAEWERFIKRLWKLQWFENPTPLNQSTMDLFWNYTQGIPHIAVILFYLAQARAVIAGREILDERLIEKIYHEELAVIHPMIKALQSGRKEEILKYADLDIPADHFRSLIASGQDLPDSTTVPSEPKETELDKYQQLTNMLIQTGVGTDIAPVVAEQAIHEKPGEDLFGLMAHIRDLKDKKPSPKKTQPKSVHIKPIFTEQDLRLLRKDSGEGTYQQLKKEGLIISIEHYI